MLGSLGRHDRFDKNDGNIPKSTKTWKNRISVISQRISILIAVLERSGLGPPSGGSLNPTPNTGVWRSKEAADSVLH
jgi:hypothetical protein